MKRTRTLLGATTVVVALAVSSGALAAKAPGNGNGQKTDTTAAPAPAVAKASAALNIGQVVKPRPKATKAGASGRFTATITGLEMKWTLTYKQLSGPATAAHVHAGAKGANGGVVVALCDAATCKSGLTGTVTLTQQQLDAMKSGATYVNVHTAKNTGGEIRGQVTVVG